MHSCFRNTTLISLLVVGGLKTENRTRENAIFGCAGGHCSSSSRGIHQHRYLFLHHVMKWYALSKECYIERASWTCFSYFICETLISQLSPRSVADDRQQPGPCWSLHVQLCSRWVRSPWAYVLLLNDTLRVDSQCPIKVLAFIYTIDTAQLCEWLWSHQEGALSLLSPQSSTSICNVAVLVLIYGYSDNISQIEVLRRQVPVHIISDPVGNPTSPSYSVHLLVKLQHPTITSGRCYMRVF